MSHKWHAFPEEDLACIRHVEASQIEAAQEVINAFKEVAVCLFRRGADFKNF